MSPTPERKRTHAPGDPVERSVGADTIPGLVVGWAAAHPARVAVLDGETAIDYRRLTERASAIAGELAARGVAPGALVGVCMGRSWELVATLLGVLRSGCAYVPLDPEYPRERVRYMLEHAGAVAAVVDGEERAELCGGVPEIVRLAEVGEPTAAGVDGPSATDLAYVIYTSGSSGRPKGVAVEHRNVVALSRAMGGLVGDEELSGVLASSSICFDASVLDLLVVLSLGGTVVLADNVLALPDLPAVDRVRTVITVPTAMRALLAAGGLPTGVRCVFFGGEVLQRSLVERLRATRPELRVVNAYGPTETTIFATATEVAAGDGAVTIGRPVPGTRAYVLDDALRPVPAGVPGELYLAGDQLARGYLHDEELTSERFLAPDPDGPVPEARLYRTGDRCRWTDDGELEFLERVDEQVKVRGFRIELGEIESTLERMEGVVGAAAAVVDGNDGQRTLVGYVVARGEVTAQAVRAHLAERLPGYMVPQVVTFLDELPRLPSGKLDRKALPTPEPGPTCGPRSRHDAGGDADLALRLAGLSDDDRHAALLSVVRSEIASVRRLQGPEEVPADRPLDDLGIDSLTAVELTARLAAALGREVSAAAVLVRATPAAVAEHLLESLGAPVATGTAAQSAPAGRPRGGGGAPDALGRLQAQMRSYYPPFQAAKAPAWSVDDKATLVAAIKDLVSRSGRDPHTKVVRTGSGHRGIVADAYTGEERETIVWTTNLYLGLNRDSEVIGEARAALESLGTGMGTSAVAGGVTDLHREFERGFAELVGKPAACLFPTGFTANLGAIAGLVGEGDVVVMDQLCHASIVDGARLSGAKIRTFRHDDAADLEAVLEAEASPYRTMLVVLEGVYSMGEGAAPVAEIARTAKRHGALVLVDEAHSFGFYGPRGAGLCAAQGATGEVDLVMTTLSKALGSLGGIVAGSREHVALLKSSARAYVFQASTSPADMAAALAALRRIREDDTLRDRLWDTTAYMRERFTAAGYYLGDGDATPVVTPHFPDKDKLFAIVDGLFERGVLASAVTYPVVESGKSRLRFICSAAHTREDVDRTVEALIDAEREAEARRAAGDGSGAASPRRAPDRAALAAWARAFSAALEERLAGTAGPTPDLAVSFRTPDGDPVAVEVRGREVAVRDPATTGTPSCSLLLADDRALSALESADLEGLLGSVLDGTCVLHGEVEPFVWLTGRLAELSPAAPAQVEPAALVGA